MKKLPSTLFAALACLALSLPVLAAGPYRYLSPSELERKLKAKEPLSLVDIQVEEDYAKHHVTGARPTYAYPVKSPEDKGKLDAVVGDLTASSIPVVIVCPRGAGGAERTFDYLKEHGVPEERLFILEKGQSGWTCAELTEGQ